MAAEDYRWLGHRRAGRLGLRSRASGRGYRAAVGRGMRGARGRAAGRAGRSRRTTASLTRAAVIRRLGSYLTQILQTCTSQPSPRHGVLAADHGSGRAQARRCRRAPPPTRPAPPLCLRGPTRSVSGRRLRRPGAGPRSRRRRGREGGGGGRGGSVRGGRGRGPLRAPAPTGRRGTAT